MDCDFCYTIRQRMEETARKDAKAQTAPFSESVVDYMLARTANELVRLLDTHDANELAGRYQEGYRDGYRDGVNAAEDQQDEEPIRGRIHPC